MKKNRTASNSEISQIVNLFNCALADGYFAESEKKLLNDIASRLGVGKDFINAVYDSKDNFTFELPNTHEEKMQHLIDLVFMMMIDCKINKKEIDFCKKIAINIGFRPDSVELLISQILKDIQVDISCEDKNISNNYRSINYLNDEKIA